MNVARFGRLAILGAALALAVPAVALANEVTKWNEIAVSTVNAQPPITSAPSAGAVFIAMVQGAVYGAVNAADRHGKPYLIDQVPEGVAGRCSCDRGVPRAVGAVPCAARDAGRCYAASLAAIPNNGEDQGKAVGEMAAAAMLAEGHDGRTVIGCAFGPVVPGVWQPLPGPSGAPACDPSPWVKDAQPFVVQSASQFRTAGPYPLGSAAYATDYNEVKEIGSLTSATRMPGQTYTAAFWNTNPAANYNAIARRFVDQLSLDVSDSARLFAMLDLTAADALINTWNDKYHWNFWRPIFAIRQIGASDGNPATAADTTWTPLFSAGFPTSPPLPPSPLPVGGVGGPLGTPPYPDHPSGATAYASASMNALASFFGTDEMTFYATSSRFPGNQRTFNRFSDLTNEILDARVWAGIHFRNPDAQAATLGREVARYIHKHLFAAAH